MENNYMIPILKLKNTILIHKHVITSNMVHVTKYLLIM